MAVCGQLSAECFLGGESDPLLLVFTHRGGMLWFPFCGPNTDATDSFGALGCCLLAGVDLEQEETWPMALKFPIFVSVLENWSPEVNCGMSC